MCPAGFKGSGSHSGSHVRVEGKIRVVIEVAACWKLARIGGVAGWVFHNSVRFASCGRGRRNGARTGGEASGSLSERLEGLDQFWAKDADIKDLICQAGGGLACGLKQGIIPDQLRAFAAQGFHVKGW